MESQTGPNIKNRWDRLKHLGLAEAALLYTEALKLQRGCRALCLDPKGHHRSNNQSKPSMALAALFLQPRAALPFPAS